MSKIGTRAKFGALCAALIFGLFVLIQPKMESMDQLRLVPEKTEITQIIQDETTIASSLIIRQYVYQDGHPVAFVDRESGDCVTVWYPEGRFSDCRDIDGRWQSLFQKSVPAGTDYPVISREWDGTFSPDNWTSEEKQWDGTFSPDKWKTEGKQNG
jgi:hypothetical protein